MNNKKRRTQPLEFVDKRGNIIQMLKGRKGFRKVVPNQIPLGHETREEGVQEEILVSGGIKGQTLQKQEIISAFIYLTKQFL